MSNMQVARSRADIRKDVKVKGFTGATRQRGDSNFTPGEYFYIPKDYEVRAVKMPNNIKAEYAFVEMCDDKGVKTEEARRLFPSIFTRAYAVYEEVDGEATPTGEMITNEGNVSKIINNEAKLDDAIKAIAGKVIAVTSRGTIQTVRYGATEVSSVEVLDFDTTVDVKEETPAQGTEINS